MTEEYGKTVGSGPGGIVLPGDLDEGPGDPGDGKFRQEERVLSRLDQLAEMLERRQVKHGERVVAGLEDIGRELSILASAQRVEALDAKGREAALHGIREWLESTWTRYMTGADRAEEAFQETGRKLDWLIDDSRELRRRVSPPGRAGTGFSAALLGGLISCALLAGLAVAGGLVEVRWMPHEGGVAGASMTERRFQAESRRYEGVLGDLHPDVVEMPLEPEVHPSSAPSGPSAKGVPFRLERAPAIGPSGLSSENTLSREATGSPAVTRPPPEPATP